MKLIKNVLEIIGWLTITMGTTLGVALITLVFYLKWPNDSVKTVSIIITSISFILGAIWATRIWLRHGTIEWLSGIRRIS